MNSDLKNTGSNNKIFHHLAYGLLINSEWVLMGLASVDAVGREPDVTIGLCLDLPDLENATVRESWWQVSDSAFRMDIENVAIYQIEMGRRILIRPHPGADPAEVRIFLMGSAMGALLYQRGIFPLHGSAVETAWGAMIFVGPSGIGKSTLAAHFHRAGYRLLADDVCAISRDVGGRLQVLPAFPHLRLKTDAFDRLYDEVPPPFSSPFDVDKFVLPLGEGHASAPVPLGIVHVLKDSECANPSMTPLRGFESIRSLVDNLYRPHFLKGMQTRGEVLRLAGEIAKSAEIVQLSRQRDATHLDSLVLWLEHDWEGRPRPSKPVES